MVQELLAVHGMFRDQLSVMLQYVHELTARNLPLSAPETQTQTTALIRAGVQYNHMLHHHHQLETAMVFPALREQGLEAEVIDRLNSDHTAIAVLIDKFGDAIADLSAIEPQVVNSDLRRLADALRDHLAYEETHICPWLARLSRWF
jgi:hemerythrin-like domain-containing protein